MFFNALSITSVQLDVDLNEDRQSSYEFMNDSEFFLWLKC